MLSMRKMLLIYSGRVVPKILLSEVIVSLTILLLVNVRLTKVLQTVVIVIQHMSTFRRGLLF